MFLPSGNIFLTEGTTGKRINVMTADIIDKDDFKDELKYLFEKCGYDINKYIEAIYVKDNRTRMRIVLDELYD